MDSAPRSDDAPRMSLHPLVTGIAGAAIVAAVLWDAFETMLLPRRIGRRVRLTRYFYMTTWRSWRACAGWVPRTATRDWVLGLYGPASLILLLVCWAAALIAGFALVQSALGGLTGNASHAGMLLYMSGETFFTLGFGDVVPATGAGRWLSVLEAGTGFAFLGTVIGYLPTVYNAFSQRELMVTLLDARAGSPPTAAEFLRRVPAVGAATLPDDILAQAESWAAQVLETHLSFPLLAYYRSLHSNQSWLGALTSILDASALLVAGAEGPASDQAPITFAMARHALVDVTQAFVREPLASAPDRLDPAALAALRTHLEDSSFRLPATPEFEQRLAKLRRLYEPYAQALAAYLQLELPPWRPAVGARDNWHGGPWDRALGTRDTRVFAADEHF